MIRILLLLFLLAPVVVRGQAPKLSTIHLTDGSELRLLILENVPGRFIRVRIESNQDVIIPYDKIVSIRHPTFRYKKPYEFERGFYMAPHLAMFFGSTSPGFLRTGVGMGIKGGYQFNQWLRLAAGVEALAASEEENYNSYLMVPVYARVAGSLLARKISPEYFIDAGWSMLGFYRGGFEDNDSRGGWLLRPGVGLRNHHFTFHAGYQIQQATFIAGGTSWDGSTTRIEQKRIMKNIYFSFSYTF